MSTIIQNVQNGHCLIKEFIAGSKYVSLSIEGCNLFPTYPFKVKISIIQIGVNENQIFIFDILTCPDLIQLLKPILESVFIIKVLHNHKEMQASLSSQFQINLRGIFDWKFAVGSPFNSNDNYDLSLVCKYYSITISELNQVRKGLRYWLSRPLTEEMLNISIEKGQILWQIFLKCCKRTPIHNHDQIIIQQESTKVSKVKARARRVILKPNEPILIKSKIDGQTQLEMIKSSLKSICVDWGQAQISGKSIKLIAIGTNKNTFIFDINSLPKILPDIKKILESDCLTKIIFGQPVNELKNLYGIQMVDVFDLKTQFCKIIPNCDNLNLFEMCLKFKSDIPRDLIQTLNSASDILGSLSAHTRLYFFLFENLRKVFIHDHDQSNGQLSQQIPNPVNFEPVPLLVPISVPFQNLQITQPKSTVVNGTEKTGNQENSKITSKNEVVLYHLGEIMNKMMILNPDLNSIIKNILPVLPPNFVPNVDIIVQNLSLVTKFFVESNVTNVQVHLMSKKVLSFDCKISKDSKISLLLIGTEEFVYIIDMNSITSSMSQILNSILQDSSVLKVGFKSTEMRKMLKDQFQITVKPIQDLESSKKSVIKSIFVSLREVEMLIERACSIDWSIFPLSKTCKLLAVQMTSLLIQNYQNFGNTPQNISGNILQNSAQQSMPPQPSINSVAVQSKDDQVIPTIITATTANANQCLIGQEISILREIIKNPDDSTILQNIDQLHKSIEQLSKLLQNSSKISKNQNGVEENLEYENKEVQTHFTGSIFGSKFYHDEA